MARKSPEESLLASIVVQSEDLPYLTDTQTKHLTQMQIALARERTAQIVARVFCGSLCFVSCVMAAYFSGINGHDYFASGFLTAAVLGAIGQIVNGRARA